MSYKIVGGCQCGSVRYESSEQPIIAGCCYCKNCQKFSGTGHATNILLPKRGFNVSGEVSSYKYIAESGNEMFRVFCPKCGSPVYGGSSGNPDGIMIRVGGLDDPTIFNSEFNIYLDSAQEWDLVDATIPSFPRMMPRP